MLPYHFWIVFCFFPVYADTEFTTGELGVVTDAYSDGKDLYFFEIDNSIENKDTWIKNAKIRVYRDIGIGTDQQKKDAEKDSFNKKAEDLSDKHFALPMEVESTQSHLYLAVLADSCIGKTTCDYQNILSISKKTGELRTVLERLKSAIHISVHEKSDSHQTGVANEDNLYVSESSGLIWQINLDDTSKKKLLWKTDNIIMDMTASKEGHVFWIEEKPDRTNTLKMLAANQKFKDSGLFQADKSDPKPVVIDSGIQRPLSLEISQDKVYWKDLRQNNAGADQNAAAATKLDAFFPTVVVKSYNFGSESSSQSQNTDGPKVVANTVIEYKRYFPLSLSKSVSYKQEDSTDDNSLYGASHISDGYVFLVNKTSWPRVIQMKGIGDNEGKTYDIAHLEKDWLADSIKPSTKNAADIEPKIKYMRNDDHFLYVFAEYNIAGKPDTSRGDGNDAAESTEEKRYAVKRFSLPVVVPEFPESFSTILAVISSFAAAIIFGTLINRTNKGINRATMPQ